MVQAELALGAPLLAMESTDPPTCSSSQYAGRGEAGGVHGGRGCLKPWRLCSQAALSQQCLPN